MLFVEMLLFCPYTNSKFGILSKLYYDEFDIVKYIFKIFLDNYGIISTINIAR